MNLRESLEADDPVEVPPFTPKESLARANGFVHGFGEARDIRLAVSTGGPELRIHNLTEDTRSAEILRDGLTDSRSLYTALRAQLDAMPFWEPESDDWGPDPWKEGKDVRREPDV